MGEVIDWLLEGDPTVRWQVERDLLDEPADVWSRTRARIAHDGWGTELLGHQDPSGRWASGLYSPKWTSTTYTLLLLRRLGLDPNNEQARKGCKELIDAARWIDGGITYWDSHRFPEACVNAMVASVCAYFGYEPDRVASILDGIALSRTEDGGWNCRAPAGDTHGSFHTTISALEALSICRERGIGGDLDALIDEGQEFLLSHSMFRSHTTGEVIDPAWLSPHFPPRWHYDVLRGLDHLASSRAPVDDRCEEAITILADARRPDGRWSKGPDYGGHRFFRMEPGRVAGRWNTLRARRVLRWWGG